MSKVHYTWEQIESCIHQYAEGLSSPHGFDCIVALSRGGCIPGVMFSHLLKIPMVTLDITAYDEQDQPIEPILTGVSTSCRLCDSNVLVVDDIFDRGETMQAATQYLSLAYIPSSITIVTLFSKVASPILTQLAQPHEISYVTLVPKDEWVVFPWEITAE